MTFVSLLERLLLSPKVRTTRNAVIFTVLTVLLCASVYASAAPPRSLVILPPANKTGKPALDWLATGIQDTMNVDLWGVSSVRTRAITEYGNLMNYNLERMRNLDGEAAVKLAQEAKVDLVWRGEYVLADKNLITLTYWALDSKSGAVLHKQEIKGPLDDIVPIISRMTTSLLSPSGIFATRSETDRITVLKTTSARAFEQNALGFAKQMQRISRLGSMMFDKRDWIEHCQKAVALDPAYAEAYVNLGWALQTDGSLDAAFRAFIAAVTLKPSLLDGWMGLGYIHRARGNIGMALDAFQKAVELNGQLEWPREELKKVIATASPAAKQSVAVSRSSAAEPSLLMFESTLTSDEKRLLSLAEHDSPDIRMDAIKSLALSRKAEALPFLKQMINKPNQAFEVLKLIANIDMAAAAPYLTEALEKRIAPDETRLSGLTEQNVLGVIQLIKRRAVHQAVPALIQTLADRSSVIRESAALTLGDLGKQEALEPLSRFAAGEPNPQTRIAAHVALVKLGDAGAEEMLRTIFSEGKDMGIINYATKLMKQRKIKLGDK